jgi:hypothetical protein
VKLLSPADVYLLGGYGQKGKTREIAEDELRKENKKEGKKDRFMGTR